MVAALCAVPGRAFDREIDRGYTLPVPKGWVLRENKWRAARYGLDAEIIVDEDGHGRAGARGAAPTSSTSCGRPRSGWAARPSSTE